MRDHLMSLKLGDLFSLMDAARKDRGFDHADTESGSTANPSPKGGQQLVALLRDFSSERLPSSQPGKRSSTGDADSE